MQQGRSDDDRQCRNAWSGFDNKNQEVGSGRKSEEEEVQSEILDHQEEQSLPKELHECGGQEVVTSKYGASEDVESACSGFAPLTQRFKLRRQMAAAAVKEKTSLCMEAYGLEVEEKLSTVATQYWAGGAWIG